PHDCEMRSLLASQRQRRPRHAPSRSLRSLCGECRRQRGKAEVRMKGRWFALNAGASNWLWLSLAVIAADQWTKYLVVRNFEEFESITVWPLLDFMRLHNEGAAFSFLSQASGWQRWLFTVLGIGVSVVIL